MISRYYIAKTWNDINRLIECCKNTGYCCFDYETNGKPLYMKSFKPTLLSISFQAGSGVAIPLDHFEIKKYGIQFNWKEVLKKIGRELFQNLKVVKLAWNFKFDDQINKKFGIRCKGTCLDGMLEKYLLNEERPNGLKDMVRKYLPEFGDYEKDGGFDKLPWDQKPLDKLCKYGCMDTDCTFRLTIFFEQRLIEVGLYNLYRNLYMPASRVLTDVESTGLYLDKSFNQKLLNEYKPKIDAARQTIMELPRVKKFQKYWSEQKIEKYIKLIQDQIDDLDPDDQKDSRKISSREKKIANIRAGIFTTKKELDLIRPINLGSPVDLPALMFSEKGFGFPIIKYTVNEKTGKDTDKPSTDEDTLVELRLTIKKPDSPKAIFLDKLLELRGLEKMYKTYILGWNEKVQDDNALHGRYLLHGTTSGRLSCISGNSMVLTQHGEIPIRDLENFYSGVITMTEDGWEPITHFIYKGKEEMYEVTLDDGTTIECTLDHKFITNMGTKKLREIYNKDRSTINNKIKLLKYEE